MTLSQEQQPEGRRESGSAAAGQPRSRREARNLERRGGVDEAPEAGTHPSGVVDLSASGNIWDNISRRAASQLTDAASEAERKSGRRVAERDEAPLPEPLTYATQARPNIPTYDGAQRSRPVSAPAAPSTAASGDAPFRPRSFAPGASEDQPRQQPTVAGLDYHTQTRTPPLRSAAPKPEVDAELDHTLTRREIRSRRETGTMPPFSAADLAPATPARATSSAPVVPAPIVPPVVPPVGAPFAGKPAFEDTATAPMTALDRAELADDRGSSVQVTPPPRPQLRRPAASVALNQPIKAPEPAPPVPAQAEAQELSAPVRQPPVVPSPFASEPEPITGLQGFEALIAQASAGLDAPSVPATGPTPVQAARAVDPEPFVPTPAAEQTFTPPRGHWSVQAQEEDEPAPLPFDGLLSRNVGTSTGSNNALIMPNDPQPDLMQALNSTGEILVTGSLDLPRSLASTGASSDHFDSSEIDRLFEASQVEHHADVAPVRAARAVSTHTSTRSVVTPATGGGMSLPVILAVTAGGLAVIVAGLFISGLAFGWF